MRHAHCVFVAYHNREAGILDSASLDGKFTTVPVCFHKYEVPYGFLAKIPWYLSYRGLALAGGFANNDDSSWNISVSEWVQKCVF